MIKLLLISCGKTVITFIFFLTYMSVRITDLTRLRKEPLGAPEPEEELQECSDHRPNTFEKGKPRSILSLPILANLHDILYLFYYVACT